MLALIFFISVTFFIALSSELISVYIQVIIFITSLPSYLFVCTLVCILSALCLHLWWRISESNRWPPACKAGALANWANSPCKRVQTPAKKRKSQICRWAGKACFSKANQKFAGGETSSFLCPVVCRTGGETQNCWVSETCEAVM